MAKSGVHRAKTWEIALFAFNNTSTNLWMVMVNFVAYYLTGYVGVGVVLASTLMTSMRIWDAVTDPLVGFIVDKTNGKFGKNRPFIAIGNIILLVTTALMFFVTHHLPENFRLIYFIVIYLFYIIGYTCQTVVTKSAQSSLTNDPQQRPTFGIYDGIYNAILFATYPVIVSNFLIPKYGGFTAELFANLWFIVAPLSTLFAWLAIFALKNKDREEFFGTGQQVKVTFRDYWEVLKGNRAIQMLVVSASTDKLGQTIRSNATIMVIIYAIVCGNYGLQGGVAAYVTLPQLLIIFFGVKIWAQRLGQRKALMIGSWGGIIANSLLFLLFYIGNPKTMALPGIEGFNGWTFFTVSFLILWVASAGFSSLASAMVIPMTADCADYEVYRSGKYVPGLMGTLFSSVDKIISSLGTTIIGLMCALAGYTADLPQVDSPYSESIKFVGLFCLCGFIIIGYLCNIIAMKFYPLTKEKMEEIQDEIARIKSEQVQS
ncbi:MFS transporter [Streptococcus moroccensis]|uniref:Na+/melibiose symporter-like transporter n=1 Tax=Streptococcus moroccensis TaxID=1451356 RepID=A0ABT9YQ69_9STRE|nr:MFS transporter [Streptococcus moroccensis]MDQ0222128.1 Na+/melibiose symporter-like transporter [Streptococcus moroccensis]